MIPRIAIDIFYTMWPILILSSIVLITLRTTYILVNKKNFVLYQELIRFSFVIYIILLFELLTTTDYYSYGNNFTPFFEILRHPVDSPAFLRNVIGNVALFIPFGYYASYFCKINKIYLILIINTITSLTIETIQSYIGRSFDIDDIILNVLGGVIGYYIYRISAKLLVRYPNKFRNHLLLNLICIVIILFLVLMILNLYEVI